MNYIFQNISRLTASFRLLRSTTSSDNWDELFNSDYWDELLLSDYWDELLLSDHFD